ncbi:MAG: AEC family transporter, partial [Lachnospiraceae bacterium]|nr:AEC family transporter [Lachnospiraceae bacterium]
MAIALITGKKLLVMFILLMIGIVVSKMGIVKGEGKTQLSNILLMLVSPMVIISSYQTKYDAQLAANLLDSFLLATIGFAIVIISSSLFIRKNNSEYTIERINVIYSNGGFIGIPLVGAVLGK